MANFAIIESNIVTNVIVTDDKEQSEKDLGITLVEITADNPGGIGFIFDPDTQTFTAPVVTTE